MSTNIKNMAKNIIGFKDLRLNADKYIKAIARGKSFTVVRRSKPIFNQKGSDFSGEQKPDIPG